MEKTPPRVEGGRFQFGLGERVTHALHHVRDHEGWTGHVIAREMYETFGGTQYAYMVRWIEPNGKVSEQTVRMFADELKANPPKE